MSGEEFGGVEVGGVEVGWGGFVVEYVGGDGEVVGVSEGVGEVGGEI